MNEPRRVVLIGDPDAQRFGWLRDLLAEEFGVRARQAKTFEDVKNLFHDKSAEFYPRVVFLTDDLPFSHSLQKRDPRINFIKLEELFFGADLVCIVTKEDEPQLVDLTRRPHHVHLRHFPPTIEERQRILIELGCLGSGLPFSTEAPAVKRMLKYDPDDGILRRQICSLSESYSFESGLTHLCRLIGRCLNCDRAQTMRVTPLTRGKSGAIVFHVLKHTEEVEEYVLKLISSDSLWKLETEVRGHLEAEKETGVPGYRQHVARLRKPHREPPLDPDHPERRFIVDSGRWYAIHYDFLGGRFGKFIDLETELTAEPATLIIRTSGCEKFSLASELPDAVFAHRLKVFGAALDGLCEIWYGKDQLGGRSPETIWKLKDAPERKFVRLPPYWLTRRVKSWVQDFLDSQEVSIGARLIPDWAVHRERVLALVGDSDSAFKDPNRTTTFTRSQAHGDLNSANIFLWLQYDKHPFLIDLPSYQKDGHALQDFARLEVEIKLALLDRQAESPVQELAAYDYSQSQIPLWIELEDGLLSKQALVAKNLRNIKQKQKPFEAQGYKDNVELCYKLVMMLRQRACAIQQRPLAGAPDPSSFEDEYLPALLYHSVRAIGYPSLSIFKRLLAVYASASILGQINRQ